VLNFFQNHCDLSAEISAQKLCTENTNPKTEGPQSVRVGSITLFDLLKAPLFGVVDRILQIQS
jgi:hypothetical protein